MDHQPEEVLLRPPPPASLLPEDMLADILSRLAPRGLAMARAVCRAWLATVDAHNLLRTDLLPLKLAGIFVNFWNHPSPEYFCRPSTSPMVVSGHQMEYVPTAGKPSMRTRILGQCNGLLLLEVADDYYCTDHVVVNSATRAWARVPPAPSLADEAPSAGIFFYHSYLVFDPTLSPYYEVISFPHVTWSLRTPLPATVVGDEWPLKRCVLRVFSSRVNRWEERCFVREGGAATTILDMSDYIDHRYSIYSRGALYVLCQTEFVMRISLSHKKYRAVQPPEKLDEKYKYIESYLGKSEKGVYLASCYRSNILRVWMLDESCGQMEWSLKHTCDLTHVLRLKYQQASGPWVLNDANYKFYRHCFPNHVKEEPIEEKYEWDSDNDNVLGNEDTAESHKLGMVSVLGFHPFKEVIYLNLSVERGLAYHWNSSKIQDLGKMYPTEYGFFEEWGPDIEVAFPYTPCWM